MPWSKRRKWAANHVGWQVWFLRTRSQLVVSLWEHLETGLSSWSCNALTTPAGDFDPHFPMTHLPSHPHLCQYNTMCLSLKIQQSHLFYWKCACAHLVAQSCPTLCDPMDCSPPGSSVHGDSPGKNAGVGSRALLQGISPTQGSNSGLTHCRWILYHLSHQESTLIKI